MTGRRDYMDRLALDTAPGIVVDGDGRIAYNTTTTPPKCRAGHATRREFCGECDVMPPEDAEA